MLSCIADDKSGSYGGTLSMMPDSNGDLASRFVTTRWDLVLDSAQTQLPGADQALADLCRIYWRPLYAFVRRRGFSATDAEDLVQGFFERFLQDRALKKADPERGRFRAFLLRSIENFLANEWDRTRAAKRGGAFRFVTLDEFVAAERDAAIPATASSPEAVFDRGWAQAIVDAAFEELRTEADQRGKSKLFDELKGFLTADETSYEKAAARLDMSLATVKAAIHRLRGNFRTVVRREVARTVSSPGEIDDELRYLSSVLAQSNSGELIPS
jgi:RNA polymerase sigma-70 factor (ECF subfamily)